MTRIASPPTQAPSGITVRHVTPSGRLRRYAFLFMRLSGIALLLLAVGHMVIQHILNDVHTLTVQFVAAQWDSWGWKAYDLLLLAFAMTHGMNGLRTVLEDYIHSPRAMRAISWALVIFLIITLIVAGYAIAVFDPASIR